MNIKKIPTGLLLLLLCSGIFYHQSDYAGESLNQSETSISYFSILKKAVTLVSAIGVALAAHIITEFPIVVAHEYGHHVGNYLGGGCGGSIYLRYNLPGSPLGLLLPFFAGWGMAEKYGNNPLVLIGSGPLFGITANYAIMAGANGYNAAKKGYSEQEILKIAFTSPVSPYKDISNEVARMIIEQEGYHMGSFSEISMTTFNLLKSSKMLGEFFYGFTPISFDNGDGQRIWQMFGLKKDMTITPLQGVFLATIPLMGAIAFGIAKGILAKKNNQKLSSQDLESNDHAKSVEKDVLFEQSSHDLTAGNMLS